MYFFAGNNDPSLAKIYFDLARAKNRQRTQSRGLCRSPKSDTEPCQELAHGKGLIDEVVRPGIERSNFVAFIRSNRENNDRKTEVCLPDILNHRDSIGVG